MKLTVEAPINSLSFGNVSMNILRELWRRQMQIALFPIGNTDISAYDKIDPNFKTWLQDSINNRYKRQKPENTLLKIWHINGSEAAVLSGRKILYTFYEVDGPTEVETAITDNWDKVIFSSSCARDLFKMYGNNEERYESVPLGFDEDFYETGRKYHDDGITSWGLCGKFEAKRKKTAQILKLWASKYGNNKKHKLTCCITNPFYGQSPEQVKVNNEFLVNQALEGKKYWNINFLPYLKTNSEVNEYINSINIELSGLSGGEGWNLPLFNALCLGKWAPVLNAHAHKDYATEQNCVLIKPTGREISHDGVFFQQGTPFNQGNFYSLNDEAMISAFEAVESKAFIVNEEGKKLKDIFSYKNTVDKILSYST